MVNWWQGATPHRNIREGRVNESLFAANLAQAVQGEGPREYADPETFFDRTYLTQGLKELLQDVVRLLAGRETGNAVVELQTSFGGGKTHAELAVYHLLAHPEAAMGVPQVADAIREAGLEGGPSKAPVAVLAGADIDPFGRKTAEGITIRSLWGEMAYQLGGAEAFALVAEHDARLVSPGIELLRQVIERAGPSAILLDETLHYIDKVSSIKGAEGDLARQTVAFLRELTEAVATAGRCSLIISLTASRTDMLSPQAQDWLASLKQQVTREARKRAPTEGSEVHEIVRRRLFERVDEGAADQTARAYRSLYSSLGLPSQYSGSEYEERLRRAYPFHPELVTVLYEQWGAKPAFQLTRGTLRFLALVLQDRWRYQSDRGPELLQLGDVPLDEAGIRAITKEVAGDPQWEAVLGSDIAAGRALVTQPAKAQEYDKGRGGERRQAQHLATTILMHSVGGGESPGVTLQGIHVACARPGGAVAEWEDVLKSLGGSLFYFYQEGARYSFRIEPNVISLHQSYRGDPNQAGEVEAYIAKQVLEKSLGDGHGFGQVIYAPENGGDIPDDEELKLVVMGFDQPVTGEELSPSLRQVLLGILEKRGQAFRQNLNTVLFGLADSSLARTARETVADYLAWQRIQKSTEDWARIGGAQQQVVKDNLETRGGSVRRALIDAYAWAAIPVEETTAEQTSKRLGLRLVRLGAYGPGKLVAPMIWERLSSEDGRGQEILPNLTPETLLDRYGERAWPAGEPWVTTRQLWERFHQQVGLPMLARRQTLLDTLRLGQIEGRFAVGHLYSEELDRAERDSYATLFFRDSPVMPGNAPELGHRWLLLRPAMYEQVTSQPSKVRPPEVLKAIVDLAGDEQPVKVAALRAILLDRVKPAQLDDSSLLEAVRVLVRDQRVEFRAELEGPDVPAVPPETDSTWQGFVRIPTTPPLPPTDGRTITISGAIALGELAPLYKNILQVISANSPKEFRIKLNISASFDEDPGGAFDANLEDGWKQGKAFPSLTLADSKRQ